MVGEKSVQIRYRTNEAILSEVQISSDGKTFNRSKKSSHSLGIQPISLKELLP